MEAPFSKRIQLYFTRPVVDSCGKEINRDNRDKIFPVVGGAHGIRNRGKDMNSFWKDKVIEHIEVVGALLHDEAVLANIVKAGEVIVDAYKNGCKLLICGNGGSAADSQHIATELVSKFLIERKAIDAEALSVNTSTLTAIGNDYTFDTVFSRQVEAKGKKGDVLLAISTSGNSRNIIEAIKVGKEMGLVTIGMTGSNKESLICKTSDYCIAVPSNHTPRIQEAHIMIGHMLCEFIEQELF